MQKKWADRALLVVFIVLAVLLYRSAADYPGIAQKTSAKYARFLAMFIGSLALVQLAFGLVRDYRAAGRAEILFLTENRRRFVGLLVALVLFAIAFEPLGFYLSGAIFIPIVSWMLGYRRPIVIGLTTAGTLGFVYLIFVQLLSVRLPGIEIF